jgi:hypothetical protein
VRPEHGGAPQQLVFPAPVTEDSKNTMENRSKSEIFKVPGTAARLFRFL